MPEMEAWQAFAGICSVIIFLGSVAFALKRLGVIRMPEAKPAEAAPDKTAFEQKVADLEREMAALRLHLAENFVRRDDYVISESRVIGLLETHSVMLARLERLERIGAIK